MYTVFYRAARSALYNFVLFTIIFVNNTPGIMGIYIYVIYYVCALEFLRVFFSSPVPVSIKIIIFVATRSRKKKPENVFSDKQIISGGRVWGEMKQKTTRFPYLRTPRPC